MGLLRFVVRSPRALLWLRRSFAAAFAGLSVATLWLVGSAARDELRPDSDVDVLVELSRPLGLDFVGIGLSLEAWLGRSVDVGTPDGLHERVRERIRRGAVRAA